MERVENYGSMIEQVYLGSPNKSAFDRSHHNYLTGKLGTLIPTRLDEVYPGDRIKGHIQGVVNFEPLAAPILGNLRYKQESFYVPDSILWKNAHKFYTGKKGFNTPRPSMSPRAIFVTYENAGFLPFPTWLGLKDLMDILKPSYYSDVQSIYDIYRDQIVVPFTAIVSSLSTFAHRYQVYDLVQPLLDLISNYFTKNIGNGVYDSLMYKQLVKDVSSSESSWDAECKLLCQFMYEYYSFLFGASSFFDYIGFPCYTKWDQLFLKDIYDLLLQKHPIPTFLKPYDDISDLFSDISLCWLPFRAAYVVWYWNYRDELLETDAFDPESDEFIADTPTNNEIILLTLIRYRCWYKDTFTTALTHTGDGNLVVPIIPADQHADTKQIFYDDYGNTLDNVSNYESALQAGAITVGISIGDLQYRVPMNYFQQQFAQGSTTDDTVDTLSLDLFDRIKRLQKFVQKKLILGYEYDDVVWSSFLVKLSNVRMRIPEILGRGSDLVELNTVVNNTNIPDGQIAGDKTAVAWVQGRQSDINYFAEEHGYFLSFMTILPIQSYSGGMQRLWLKREQFDVFWPEFATMGMDAVYNIELAAPVGMTANGSLVPSGLTDEQAMSVFGYQGRYYDLKCRQDEEHGRLRTDLNYLTFARDFDSSNLPKLNYIFVHCHPSLDMFVLDDPKQDVFRADIYHALDFERRLPVADMFV